MCITYSRKSSLEKRFLNDSASETESAFKVDAQSAFKVGTQEKAGTELVHNSPAASRKLHETIHMDLKNNMMLCLRGKYLTGLSVPSPELLITYCSVSLKKIAA